MAERESEGATTSACFAAAAEAQARPRAHELDRWGEMSVQSRPALYQQSPYSFQTMTPSALAAWLIAEHGFAEQMPTASEVYRLAADGMVIAIFRLGLVLAAGRNAAAAVLLLADLCDAEGGER